LARPWYRLRAIRVFRDETSLGASSGLKPSIIAALKESEFLLLLASPAAVASTWVGYEIEWWLENRGTEKLLIAIAKGDRTTALPKALLDRLKEEPRDVDLTGMRSETSSLADRRFRAAVLDLAAPLHGMPKNDLDGEDVRRRRWARIAVGA